MYAHERIDEGGWRWWKRVRIGGVRVRVRVAAWEGDGGCWTRRETGDERMHAGDSERKRVCVGV